MDPLVYWIWLSLSCTPDSSTFVKLLAEFDTPEGIFAADDEAIGSCIGSRNRDRAVLLRRDLKPAETLLTLCREKQIGIVTYSDPRFPKSLREISDPPVLLYYRGVLPDFDAMCGIAVVGTRHMSEYGKRSAFHISMDLARAGATIVSGMALGIDGVALAAACAVDRPTIAILGCGIDICYPKEHLTLARAIVKQGCIMTEYPPSTPPYRYHFPQRNRLISGLCAATIVIEGREKSGSLITARHAMAQGRTVYALPGNVDSETSEVTALLLKNGAKVCTAADDVIRDLEFVYTGILNPFLLSEPIRVRTEEVLSRLGVGLPRSRTRILAPRKKESERAGEGIPPPNEHDERAATDAPEPQTLAPKLLAVYRRIPADGDCAVESLVEEDRSIREVMRALLQLEIGNFVEMLPGERVRRKIQ